MVEETDAMAHTGAMMGARMAPGDCNMNRTDALAVMSIALRGRQFHHRSSLAAGAQSASK